jgi:DNA-binding CsgD family transcriptional regulator
MHISTAESESLTRLMSLFAEDYQETEVRRRVGEEILLLLNADYLASYVWDGGLNKFDGRVSINMDDANLSAYEQYYQYHDPITFQLQSRRVPTLVSQVMPQAELENTEFFNDFLKKDGLHYGVNMFAYDGNINIGDLRIWRGSTRENFSQHSLNLLMMIQPAFTRALMRARGKQQRVVTPDAGYMPTPFLTRLSCREREIASKILLGLSDKEIAHNLNIEFCTVRTHLAHIFEKLGARNRSQVVAALLGEHR